ncbi:MAG: DUF2271 domain-containing protein [Rhodobacteraceae bacterium]|nr:DUF2271 domain-containing protein [Paracoccaceae bacterium]
MKHHILAATACLAVLLANAQAEARPVTITAQLKNYSGPRAYVSVYLTEPGGRVVDTLWVAGRKGKYYGHLRDWWRSSGRARSNLHGVTGASVGSGGQLRVSADIADNLIDAGYQVRVDTSIEDQGDYPRSAVLTLGKQTSVKGRGIVRSLSLN